jgi:hypothetical protein
MAYKNLRLVLADILRPGPAIHLDKKIPVRPVQLPAGLGAVACILLAPDLLQHLGASARADSTTRTSESIFSDRSWEVRRSSRGHDDIGNM